MGLGRTRSANNEHATVACSVRNPKRRILVMTFMAGQQSSSRSEWMPGEGVILMADDKLIENHPLLGKPSESELV